MSVTLNPMITYKLSELMNAVAACEQEHLQKAAKVAGKDAYAHSHAHHTDIARAYKNDFDVLKSFQDAGADEVRTPHLLALGSSLPLLKLENSLQYQLKQGLLQPVMK
ncbi:MAG TPA: hypothetical protein VGE32_10150 [Cellvibrio sp.]